MGGTIDLDPASCAEANRIVGATRFYTEAEDGLRQDWTSSTVWLNPPYANLAPKFIARFVEHFGAGQIGQAVLLLGVHHVTTAWFAPLESFPHALCMPTKRLKFSGSTAHPGHGSVILAFGVDHESFTTAFAPLGRIYLAESSAPRTPPAGRPAGGDRGIMETATMAAATPPNGDDDERQVR